MIDRDVLRRLSRVALIPLVALLAAGAARAQMIPGYPDAVTAYDPRDVALLPPYCKYTQDFREKVPGGGDPQEIARWQAVLGPTYIHMHHYCWGLMKTNRGTLMARSAFVRTHYLSDAVTEFDYVIARAPEDFVLLPEILSRRGENLVRLGRGGVGVVSFERALLIKPDYWPPYAHISDYYKSLGEIDKARDILERGLAAAPGVPALTRRLGELPRAGQRSGKPASSAQP